MQAVCEAIADDADALARLHDRELDAATLAVLGESGFPATLALLPAGEDGAAALAGMRAALAGLATDGASLDRLAADFAAIYLTNAYGASPYESVWVHEEHLACQEPMFELRRLYAAAGLGVDDWRKRYDDHLVLQLQYLAHRLRAVDGLPALGALGAFLDEHLGYWLEDFAARVAARSDTAFYCALAVLTAAWVRRLREVIVEITGEPPTPREVIAERLHARFVADADAVAPIRFLPGAGGPSW